MATHAASASFDIALRRVKKWENLEKPGDGDKILERLYQLNIHHARLELFKDYMLLAQVETEFDGSISSHELKLRQDISRYSTALADYRGFVDSLEMSTGLGSRSAAFAARLVVLNSSAKDLELLDIAARTLALDECRSLCLDHQMTKDDVKSTYANSYMELEQKFRELYGSHNILTQWHVKEEERSNKSRDDRRQVREERQKLLSRLSMAVLGGLAVIVPIVIMTLHPTLLTVLLTTSLFVLAVGVVLAVCMPNTEPKDIVTATAAYAAIFVVLVGVLVDKAIEPPKSNQTSHGEIVGIVVGVTAGVAVLTVVVLLAWTLLALRLEKREEKKPQATSA